MKCYSVVNGSVKWKGLMWLFIGLICVVLVGGCSKSDSSKSDSSKSDPIADAQQILAKAAFSASQGFVERKLKAPSTAQFPDYNPFSVVPKQQGPDVFSWTVISYVDAQNEFGAQIRTHYVAEVSTKASDVVSIKVGDMTTWHLEFLSMI